MGSAHRLPVSLIPSRPVPSKESGRRTTVVEVERLVEVGEIDPDAVHLPGIYVHRIVVNAHPEKRIEKRTTL